MNPRIKTFLAKQISAVLVLRFVRISISIKNDSRTSVKQGSYKRLVNPMQHNQKKISALFLKQDKDQINFKKFFKIKSLIKNTIRRATDGSIAINGKTKTYSRLF